MKEMGEGIYVMKEDIGSSMITLEMGEIVCNVGVLGASIVVAPRTYGFGTNV